MKAGFAVENACRILLLACFTRSTEKLSKEDWAAKSENEYVMKQQYVIGGNGSFNLTSEEQMHSYEDEIQMLVEPVRQTERSPLFIRLVENRHLRLNHPSPKG